MSDETLLRVRQTIATCFGLAEDAIDAETRQADVEAWDSVGHLNLMLLVEDVFGVQLDVPDMERLTSVRALVEFLG